MTSRPLTVVLSIALLAASVALSGCAAGSPATATTTGPYDTPLGRYLGVFDPPTTEQQKSEVTDRIEAAMAACMTEQGFEYTPEPYSPLDQSFPGDWRLDDRDWVAQWGYGALEFPAWDAVKAANAEVGPNDAYYASLSPAEQQAYSTAAYGPPWTDAQIAAGQYGPGAVTWQDQGCYGSSRHTVLGDDVRDASQFQPLMQAVIAFQKSQFQASVYDALNAEWSDCMADAGHPGFTRQADARQSIFDAAQQLRSASPVDLADDDPGIVALHQKEIDLALADLDCREKIDYRPRSLAIQIAQEQQFVDDHKTELDELVAAKEQGG